MKRRAKVEDLPARPPASSSAPARDRAEVVNLHAARSAFLDDAARVREELAREPDPEKARALAETYSEAMRHFVQGDAEYARAFLQKRQKALATMKRHAEATQRKAEVVDLRPRGGGRGRSH